MNKELLLKLKTATTLNEIEDVSFISTGCHALNRIISGRYDIGLPIGRIVQIRGNSSTGKTLFATTILSAAQKAGCWTKLLDAENTFSKDFGKMLGLDPDTLLYSSPTTMEEAFESVVSTIEEIRAFDKDTPIIFVLDSLAVLPIKEQVERETIGLINNTDGAREASVIGQLLKKINKPLADNKATLVVINQIRSKINVMYGNPDKAAAGGRSLEFYLSVDLNTTSNKTSDVVKDEKSKMPIGIEGEIECKKNKVGKPFQRCGFRVLYDQGLDPYYGLVDLLAADGHITKSDSGRLSVKDTKFAKADFQSVLLDKAVKDLDPIRLLLGIKL
jgi:protein RecA